MNVIPEKELLRRRDLREVLTFTIDPEDAKDYDDALSFQEMEDGDYQVGVHIADVSFYVPSGSEIDCRAYERGTSVYLVGQVEPMLPEALCNDLCSLRAGEDKLCLSVLFTMGVDAEVKKYKVSRSVIRSDYRLTYPQAQAILEGAGSDALSEALSVLNGLAKRMRQKRAAAGALMIAGEELQFKLDDRGFPQAINVATPLESNHLIEEWMLLANRTIATHIGKSGKEMVYRVHDKPDAARLKEVESFRRRMGERVSSGLLDMLTIRAMAKAEYSTINIGHYGLAFDYYTHFTSPIRRYPDLMVHRLVARYILGERARGAVAPEDLPSACAHCSVMEQAAVEAERDSIKEMQALWMRAYVREVFEGQISSVMDFGLFVRLNDSHCEGLVPIRTINPGLYMRFDEKNFCIRPKRSLEPRYTLGDAVRVRCLRADAQKRQIDFELVYD